MATGTPAGTPPSFPGTESSSIFTTSSTQPDVTTDRVITTSDPIEELESSTTSPSRTSITTLTTTPTITPPDPPVVTTSSRPSSQSSTLSRTTGFPPSIPGPTTAFPTTFPPSSSDLTSSAEGSLIPSVSLADDIPYIDDPRDPSTPTPVVGLAVGMSVLVVVGIIVALVFWRRRRRRQVELVTTTEEKDISRLEKSGFHHLPDSNFSTTHVNSNEGATLIGSNPFSDPFRAETPSIIYRALKLSRWQRQTQGSQASQSIIASTDAPSEYTGSRSSAQLLSRSASLATHSTTRTASSSGNPFRDPFRAETPSIIRKALKMSQMQDLALRQARRGPASIASGSSSGGNGSVYSHESLRRLNERNESQSSIQTVTQESVNSDPRTSSLDRWRNGVEDGSMLSKPSMDSRPYSEESSGGSSTHAWLPKR